MTRDYDVTRDSRGKTDTDCRYTISTRYICDGNTKKNQDSLSMEIKKTTNKNPKHKKELKKL